MQLPEFQSCLKKKTARQETIINTYREWFGTIPPNKQYWTMCAAQTKNNQLSPGSELGQLLDSKFVTPQQFHGVDTNETVIKENQSAVPQANWYHNDFITQMKINAKEDKFNPAIVNADFISMKAKAASITAQIMALLTDTSNNVMLICNVMLNNPHSYKTDTEDITREFDSFIPTITQNKSFQYAWLQGGWSLHPQGYIYNGSGRQAKTYMGSHIFFRAKAS